MDKGKKGGVLILTLLVMFVGTIILGGLFMYLDTSLLLTIKSEDRAVEYYAADSGIEDAIAWLQHEPWGTPNESLAGWEQCNPLNPPDQPCLNSYTLGNRTVDVSVVNPQSEGFGNNTFQINSTVTADSGARTKITSYVDALTLDLYEFGDYAIASNCSVTLQPDQQNGEIIGDVIYDSACGVTCRPVTDPFCQKVNINGSIIADPPPPGLDWWPDAEYLQYVFWLLAQAAEDLPVDDDGNAQINVGDPSITNIGPLYVDGDLEIMSSDSCESTPDECPRVTLEGIVYVAGDLTIGGAHPFTLNLGNQTIFAAGSIDVDGQTTLSGSGSIIALGDIYFAPNMDSEESDFVFIMSVLGEVQLQPSGDFWGSVAGAEHVQVQPGNIVGHRDAGDVGFEFPGIEPIFDIITYNITQFK